jgi:hypothetical protein
MKSTAETLGQVLVALAGNDAHKLAQTVDDFRRVPADPALVYARDLDQMVSAAQRLWFQARTCEAVKMTSSVAWRCALTALEEGLERYLEDLHRQTEAAEG